MPGHLQPAADGAVAGGGQDGAGAGQDYQILTLSFDPPGRPGTGRGKKESYLSALKRNDRSRRSGDSSPATALTIQRAHGCRRLLLQAQTGNDFVHAGALIILSPDGKITRYINGIQYLPFDVKMALHRGGATGRMGPTIAKLLQFLLQRTTRKARTYALNVTAHRRDRRSSCSSASFCACSFVRAEAQDTQKGSDVWHSPVCTPSQVEPDFYHAAGARSGSRLDPEHRPQTDRPPVLRDDDGLLPASPSSSAS